MDKDKFLEKHGKFLEKYEGKKFSELYIDGIYEILKYFQDKQYEAIKNNDKGEVENIGFFVNNFMGFWTPPHFRDKIPIIKVSR